MQLNIFDISIVALLIMALIVGWKQGVIKEGVSLIGIVVIFLLSYSLKEWLGNLLCKYLPFLNFGGTLDGLVSLNILLYQLLAFILIFSVLYGVYQIIMKISGLLQKLVNFTLIFALPSKILGGIIGLIGGYIMIFAVLLVLMIPLKNSNHFQESNLANKIVYESPVLSSYAGNVTKIFKDITDLTSKVTNQKLSVNEANLEIIDTMLKYNMVSKKTISQLIVLDKLKTVKGLEQILERYN